MRGVRKEAGGQKQRETHKKGAHRRDRERWRQRERLEVKLGEK